MESVLFVVPIYFHRICWNGKKHLHFFPAEMYFLPQTYLWAATSHIQLVPWKLATQDGQLMIMEPCPV